MISFKISSALDKNEYNHITATYFLLAERRLKISRQEEAQTTRSNSTPSKNGKMSSQKQSSDVVDSAAEILPNNLLAPPSAGYYNNSRTGVDGTVTTVSIFLHKNFNFVFLFDFFIHSDGSDPKM